MRKLLKKDKSKVRKIDYDEETDGLIESEESNGFFLQAFDGNEDNWLTLVGVEEDEEHPDGMKFIKSKETLDKVKELFPNYKKLRILKVYEKVVTKKHVAEEFDNV